MMIKRKVRRYKIVSTNFLEKISLNMFATTLFILHVLP